MDGFQLKHRRPVSAARRRSVVLLASGHLSSDTKSLLILLLSSSSWNVTFGLQQVLRSSCCVQQMMTVATDDPFSSDSLLSLLSPLLFLLPLLLSTQIPYSAHRSRHHNPLARLNAQVDVARIKNRLDPDYDARWTAGYRSISPSTTPTI